MIQEPFKEALSENELSRQAVDETIHQIHECMDKKSLFIGASIIFLSEVKSGLGDENEAFYQKDENYHCNILRMRHNSTTPPTVQRGKRVLLEGQFKVWKEIRRKS